MSRSQCHKQQWHPASKDIRQSTNYAFSCQYLQVTQATNQIVMNCADIDIITASFAPQGGEGWCSVFFIINGDG